MQAVARNVGQSNNHATFISASWLEDLCWEPAFLKIPALIDNLQKKSCTERIVRLCRGPLMCSTSHTSDPQKENLLATLGGFTTMRNKCNRRGNYSYILDELRTVHSNVLFSNLKEKLFLTRDCWWWAKLFCLQSFCLAKWREHKNKLP